MTTGGVAFTVTGVTTIPSGTLSVTNNIIPKTFTGLITVNGGTLSGASTSTIVLGGLTQTSGSISITGTVNFNTTASQALNGTMSIATINVASGVID